MKRNPEFFIGPSQLRRETSWGSEFGWVPGRRRKGVLRAAAPDWSLVWSPVTRVGLEVRGGARVVSSGVHGGGVGVALSFLVEGQQRHVRHLDDLRNSKNPFRDSKNPPKLSKKTLQDPKKTTASESARVFRDFLSGEGPWWTHIAVHL